MDLIDSERMLIELLQQDDARTQMESRTRWSRFMQAVAERTGIPLEHIQIDLASGVAINRQEAAEAPAEEEADEATR